MSGLETFAPIARIVTLSSGVPVEIKPLRLGQMPAFTRAAQPIAGYLFIADYLSILENHAEPALEMLVAAGLKREDAAQLEQDEVVNLLSAIYEVNGDFFIRRLRPAMTQAATRAKAAMTRMAEAGALPSPGSPSTERTFEPA